jgi:hypothetical protein
MGFAKPTLRVETSDGRYCTLLEDLVFTAANGEVIVAPAGTTTDGASTPKEIWSLIPPFGSYWLAAVLHDFLYRISKRPKHECDGLLLEAMVSLGVEKVLRDAIYQGVALGGLPSFAEDRKIDIITAAKNDIEAIVKDIFRFMPVATATNQGGVTALRGQVEVGAIREP